MPRFDAPPPSNEFQIKLIKPFSGSVTHTVEMIGEPNRPAAVKTTMHQGSSGSIEEKTGSMPTDDVKELMALVQQLRGLPSHASKDIYGLDTRLELHTFDVQWTNQEDDSTADTVAEVADETKSTFKDVVDSIEAAGRQFASLDGRV